MDRPSQTNPQRDVMYCHQCENEWYRDEHGIACPECGSDFCEVIENNNDPREEYLHEDVNAEDPEEEDIDSLRWVPNPPGAPPGMHAHGTFHRTFQLDGNQLREQQDQGGQQGAGGGGLLGLLGSLAGSVLGGAQQAGNQGAQRDPGAQSPADNRSASAPGSPQTGGPGGTTIRHFSGPGFRATFATSSSSSGNLFPRDAGQPQPFQPQPHQIDHIMQQMFMNIGAGGGMRVAGGPGMMFPGQGPQMQGGGGGLAGSPFGNLFQMLGMGAGGVHGDAVFSQEGLDRIITQLMEQHQSGNAPGPATAEAINNLPKRPITAKDLDESGKAECSICMDEVDPGVTVTELPCHHWFHHDCIKAWLGEHDTCPHCRKGIMAEEHPTNNSSQPRQPSETPRNDIYRQQYGQMPGSFPTPNPSSSTPASPDASSPPPPTPGGRRASGGRRESAGNMFVGHSPPEQ